MITALPGKSLRIRFSVAAFRLSASPASVRISLLSKSKYASCNSAAMTYRGNGPDRLAARVAERFP
jgi:hypothetical protein